MIKCERGTFEVGSYLLVGQGFGLFIRVVVADILS
jgi:hypothetical protein